MAQNAVKKSRSWRDELRTELPRLLREDVEVRGQIIALLGEYLTTREETAAILAEIRQMRADFDRRMDELGRRIEEQGRRIEEQGRRIEEQGRRIEEQGGRIEEQGRHIEEQGRRIEEQGRRIEEQGRRIEEQGRRIEEQGRYIGEHTQELAAMRRSVMGLGARWGLLAEESFRAGIQALLAHQPEVQVSRWLSRDESGEVFGYPADVEVDVVVRNGVHLIAEIKSSISRGDVVIFKRKIDFYSKATGQKPTAQLMIGPFVEDRAIETAKHFGIEISVGVTPPTI
jgi:hypothetical protein